MLWSTWNQDCHGYVIHTSQPAPRMVQPHARAVRKSLPLWHPQRTVSSNSQQAQWSGQRIMSLLLNSINTNEATLKCLISTLDLIPFLTISERKQQKMEFLHNSLPFPASISDEAPFQVISEEVGLAPCCRCTTACTLHLWKNVTHYQKFYYKIYFGVFWLGFCCFALRQSLTM